MIIGIGHDLTDVTRISDMLKGRLGERLMERILTPDERILAGTYKGVRLSQYVAGRFAAKEAVAKAFGCGIGGRIGFEDIHMGRDDFGKPVCALSQTAWESLGLKKDEIVIHVTITHERALASAFVMVERMKRQPEVHP